MADIPKSIDLSAPPMNAVLFIRYVHAARNPDSKVSRGEPAAAAEEKKEEAAREGGESARPKSLLSLRRCTNDFASSAVRN